MSEIRILAPVSSRSYFGAERANIDLLLRLQHLGVKVRCLVRHEDWPENRHLREVLRERELEWEKAPFLDYPSRRYLKYWPKVVCQAPGRYYLLNRAAADLAARWGATHIHLFNPFQAISLYRFIQHSELPVIYRCGDHPATHNMMYRYTWRWLGARATFFVTESEYIRDQLLDLNIPERKIQVIRTPAVKRFVKTKFVDSDVLRPSEGITFCYVGQITGQKGVGVLLEAFETVSKCAPGSRMLVAGPLDNGFAKEVVKKYIPRMSEGSLHFLGLVDDIPGLLGASDVHVAPSIGVESYGIVVVEAKQAALPSIVFASGGLGELVKDGLEGISLADKSAEALAKAMLEYCKNPGRARLDGERARESLRDRLRTHEHDQAWRDLYSRSAKCLAV
jgi:glycosyltransferase involved in cell wall biosynthesis